MQGLARRASIKSGSGSAASSPRSSERPRTLATKPEIVYFEPDGAPIEAALWSAIWCVPRASVHTFSFFAFLACVLS